MEGNGKCMHNFVGKLLENGFSKTNKEWEDNIKMNMREV
jgi:hypothetical protein